MCIRRGIRSSKGASYSLPLILIAPLLVGLMLAIVEVALLAMARFAVQAAAMNAARSAAVWHDLADPAAVEERAKLAAWMALAAVDDGSEAGPIGSHPRAAEYGAMFARLLRQRGSAIDDATAVRRFQAAVARGDITIELNDGFIRATVVYRARLRFPGASRFLDPDGAAPFEFPLSASVRLPLEPAMQPGSYQAALEQRGLMP